MKRVLAFLLAVLPSITAAHDAPSGWRYEAYCCNGNNHTGDCQMIPHSSVLVVAGGYEVIIGPSTHRLATRDHHFFVPQSGARMSHDGDYHGCLYPTEDDLRCFYAPPMGF